jgi:hypothetical protein
VEVGVAVGVGVGCGATAPGHVPDPASVNDWPAIGWNFQSYDPLCSVSFKTPQLLVGMGDVRLGALLGAASNRAPRWHTIITPPITVIPTSRADARAG